MILPALQVIVGLVLLWFGGDYLVRGATRIALWTRVSTTVVALTVVAMGTSLPELAVSLGAGLRDSIDIAYGNVIGSNVFNVGAILGVGGLLAVIPVSRQTIRIEYPIMFVVSAAAMLLARDGFVDRLEGVFLLIALAIFILFMIWLGSRDVAREEARDLQDEVARTAHLDPRGEARWGVAITSVVGGGVLLTLGADQAVRGAASLASLMGIQERIIGLTLMAMGTSLPELVATIVAIRHGRPEMALGNVIGSNIFNLLGILGTTAAVVTVPVNPEATRLDAWVMLGFSGAIFPMMYWDKSIRRYHAVILLAGFLTYMGYLATHAAVR